MAQTQNGLLLLAPLSTPRGADALAALPDPTEAYCGPLGVSVAVGHSPLYNVYRGVYTIDRRTGDGKGTWSFQYHGGDA